MLEHSKMSTIVIGRKVCFSFFTDDTKRWRYNRALLRNLHFMNIWLNPVYVKNGATFTMHEDVYDLNSKTKMIAKSNQSLCFRIFCKNYVQNLVNAFSNLVRSDIESIKKQLSMVSTQVFGETQNGDHYNRFKRSNKHIQNLDTVTSHEVCWVFYVRIY